MVCVQVATCRGQGILQQPYYRPQRLFVSLLIQLNMLQFRPVIFRLFLLYSALFLSARMRFQTCCGNSSDIFLSSSTKSGQFCHHRLSSFVTSICSENIFVASAKARGSILTTDSVSKLSRTRIFLLSQLIVIFAIYFFIFYFCTSYLLDGTERSKVKGQGHQAALGVCSSHHLQSVVDFTITRCFLLGLAYACFLCCTFLTRGDESLAMALDVSALTRHDTCLTAVSKTKVKVHTLDIAPLRSESPPQKRSGYGTCSQGISQFYLHTHTSSTIGMSHTCLCLPSCSWYSFTDPGGMEG